MSMDEDVRGKCNNDFDYSKVTQMSEPRLNRSLKDSTANDLRSMYMNVRETSISSHVLASSVVNMIFPFAFTREFWQQILFSNCCRVR